MNDQYKTTETGITEKQRRIYYQDIVYSVCNELDSVFDVRLVCGTVENPTNEVQDALHRLVFQWKNQMVHITNLQTENARLRAST